MADDDYLYEMTYLSWERPLHNPTHQHLLKLFPPEGLLEPDAINTLGALPKTKTGNEYTVLN